MSEKMTSQNEFTEIKLVPYNKPLSTQKIAQLYKTYIRHFGEEAKKR
jgi:hypothetical protein